MIEEPKLEVSKLSQPLSSDGRTVRVEIYRLEGEASWTLEIVDEYNNSTVWGYAFDTDSAALTEAKQAIVSGGIGSLIGPEDGKKSGKWR